MTQFSIEQAVGTVTPVFFWNFNSKKRHVVNSGGTSSSKTISILQVLILRAMTLNRKVITIVGQDFPNMRVGVLRDFEGLVKNSAFIQSQITRANKTSSTWEFKSGSIIEFNSYDDAQDAKSGKRDFLFVNEANGVSYDIFVELSDRTSDQVFMDFNPSSTFWAHNELQGTPDVDWFISNFTHNPYVSKEVVRNLKKYQTTNPNRWRVYGLGLRGIVEGCIFTQWSKASEMPSKELWKKSGYGLDFGFSLDPTALVHFVHAEGKNYYELLLYEKGLKDSDLVYEMELLGIRTDDLIVADPSSPQSIATLNDIYDYNIVKAIKGPDSVVKGIELMKECETVIVNSQRLIDEYENYKWKKIKDTWVNIPIDKFNHGIDASRYINTYLMAVGELAPYEEHFYSQ